MDILIDWCGQAEKNESVYEHAYVEELLRMSPKLGCMQHEKHNNFSILKVSD